MLSELKRIRSKRVTSDNDLCEKARIDRNPGVNKTGEMQGSERRNRKFKPKQPFVQKTEELAGRLLRTGGADE
jgi:hypothetical protein